MGAIQRTEPQNMLDSAIREILIACLSILIQTEPAIAPGAGLVREKAGRIAVSAIIDPEDYPLGNEAPPAPGAHVGVMRNWLIRTSARAEGVKVLDAGGHHVDVRIFLR